MIKRWLVFGTLGVMVGAALSCTDAYLYDERRDVDLPVDRGVSIEGEVCTPGTNDIVRPIKILLALDASQSMKVTDKDGTRATATIELFNSLPDDDEIYVSVMLFAGSTSAYLTNGGQPGFQQLNTMTPADRTKLIGQLLNFTNPSTAPDRDSTDFVKPLYEIYATINKDIADARLASDGGSEARSRYSVIFLSDGHPTNDQDDELIGGDSNAVKRIRQLDELADDVRFNTVHVFDVDNIGTNCDLTDGGCPLLIVNQDAERLQKMAELGGGEFRDFRNNEPINFLSFRFGQVRRTWLLKELVVDNLSAPAGTPLQQGDTDGDGLLDEDEDRLGTDPFEKDTDHDGFSDGVEVKFANAGFDPVYDPVTDAGIDPGCPPALRGVDSDCDGLLDCDEQIVGTNSTLSDSDSDGIPDSVEWHLGTQPASKDLEQDPDVDGVSSRQEVRMHMDARTPDISQLTVNGYRYEVRESGPIDADGRQCYAYRIDNVLLAPTRADTRDGGTGRGAGYNELYLSAAFVPSDDPNPRTVVRGTRIREVRYPMGGIKSPVDGVLHVAPEQLVDRCDSP